MPFVNVDSKYLGFTFFRKHKDDDDMLRQIRTAHQYKDIDWAWKKLLWINFTVVIYNLNTTSPLFSKIRVAYNNLYRKILFVLPRTCGSKMFVDNNVPNFEALLRKEEFSFTSRLNVSINSIIRALENCWLIKYVIWEPWHIDKLFL